LLSDERAIPSSDEDYNPSKRTKSSKRVVTFVKNEARKKAKKRKLTALVFRCSECNENLVNQFALELHLREQHTMFHCPLCKTNLNTFEELSTHTNTDHPGTLKPFLCRLCPKRYGNENTVVKHARVYHDVKPNKRRPFSRYPRVDVSAKCKHCDKIFANASCLAGHVRLVHPTEEQRICKYCLEKFETMAKLMIHSRTSHKMDKNHMCDKCPKTFAYEIQLASHQNRAHGVPFPENLDNPQR